MPRRLYRCYGAGYMHFVTTSCYQRRPLLGTARSRDLFLAVLEQVRSRYRFVVVGYVIMPEHVHLLMSEPERGDPSLVMQVIKQSFARKLLRLWRSPPIENRDGWGSLVSHKLQTNENHISQARFYDFPVFTRPRRSRSCAICIATPLIAGWLRNRKIGNGAVSGITPTLRRDRCW
jgi:REP element-mobilizing transposase RayT